MEPKDNKPNYKLNMLTTEFPMRGNLTELEPKILADWQKEKIYQKLREHCKGRKKFILHDGPPYANGKLHIGHAANRILKDIVIRSKTLENYDAPYIPGWDCHGLPIELNIEKKFGKKLAPKEFRLQCRKYAEEQIISQKKDLMRLGLIGDWENPYKTMDYKTEADTVRAIAEIYKSGYLEQGVKPVYWCVECSSALAESEVEYEDKISHAIDVLFEAKAFFDIKDKPVCIAIWTTTPWTLVANQALCVGESITYALLDVGDFYILVAEKLIKSIEIRYGITAVTIALYNGKELEHIECYHPFYNKTVPIVLGVHATDTDGTGIVNTAPAHGKEDYLVGVEYKLSMHNPVGENGCYVKDTEYFAGEHIFKANEQIISLLKDKSKLIAQNEITHSYPCCWRHKSKLIIRTTKQWFIMMNNENELKKTAIAEIHKIGFFPANAKTRLLSMVENRPDWCLSRQRHWGTPITFLIDNNGNLHPDSYNLLQSIADLIEKGGIEAWFSASILKILEYHQSKSHTNKDNVINNLVYTKTQDVVDVWFDAGVTLFSVLQKRNELAPIADMYLEGSDQHRGWFQSSLLAGCAINGYAPYKQILSHGFLVDGNGHKMSKSKGNILSIEDMANKYGVDILRLWVASTDYSKDIACSEEIMKGVQDNYRRLRNTIRFLLANISDFNMNLSVPYDNMLEIDKYSLVYLANFEKTIRNLYSEYKFHVLTQKLIEYCSEELGGFYLDILKDRLYTLKANSPERRSGQTALYYITHSLLLLLSPILAFTSEEAWQTHTKNTLDSPIFHIYQNIFFEDNEMLHRWSIVRVLRSKVLQELEKQRIASVIGSSLQAKVTLYVRQEIYIIVKSLQDEFKYIFIVSKVDLYQSETEAITVTASNDKKCDRCWHYVIENQDEICERCVANIL